jgi:hypothetical protein
MLRSDSVASYLKSSWRFTSGKITRELNFQAHTRLPEGARKTADWYRKNGFI